LNTATEIAYLVAAASFILGLRMLGSPETARHGNLLSAFGMSLAALVTFFGDEMENYGWVLFGIVIGAVVGVIAARLVEMTAMPEMVALFNGSGGAASLFLGWVVHLSTSPNFFTASTVIMAVFIGGTTFTGSLVAWAKLRELTLAGKRLGGAYTFPGQRAINMGVLIIALLGGVVYAADSSGSVAAGGLAVGILLSLLFGILLVVPIGGADMPVVIAVLNSLSGLAACAAGFAVENAILVVAGALVGASGFILMTVMCKSMNRTLVNVFAGGFGATGGGAGTVVDGVVQPIMAEDAYYLLEAADSVVIVPGYGLAVAQAQHVVREMSDLLEKSGADVRYAIHPVAGRMPGHMNVLLAEANVPYDVLAEMDDINPVMGTVDVCLVVGANDVVNPAARDDECSPIYGMPIIDVDRARIVIVLKRSMGTGFAGISNPLFFRSNTRMLFGDAKTSLQQVVSEFKD